MISLYHGTTMEVSQPLVAIGRKKVALGSQGGRNA